jgi:uncharacterized protein (TIGR03083 family)
MATASVEDLARACEAVGDLIAEIRPEQWKAPTPCTEWNVRDVVNHLVGMDLSPVAHGDGDRARAAAHHGGSSGTLAKAPGDLN